MILVGVVIGFLLGYGIASAFAQEASKQWTERFERLNRKYQECLLLKERRVR